MGRRRRAGGWGALCATGRLPIRRHGRSGRRINRWKDSRRQLTRVRLGIEYERRDDRESSNGVSAILGWHVPCRMRAVGLANGHRAAAGVNLHREGSRPRPRSAQTSPFRPRRDLAYEVIARRALVGRVVLDGKRRRFFLRLRRNRSREKAKPDPTAPAERTGAAWAVCHDATPPESYSRFKWDQSC